jgi:hypothetical protein
MRTSLALLSLSLVLAIACGESSSPDANTSHGGAGAAAGGSNSGGSPNGGSANASAGMPSNADGGVGGKPSGAGGTTAGQAGTPGGVAGAVANGGGAGVGGSGTAGACTRELLKATIDAYFKALAAHMPATLPLADSVKFTENGQPGELGNVGLWKTAGTLKYAHSALDTELCMSATQAVVPDGTTDVPVALRLKLQNQKLTEVETIVARAGDYPALSANTAALAESNSLVKWEEAVATDQRATRATLTGWMEKYFKQFPAGVCNTTSDCLRIENGGGSFVCGQGASCAAGPGAGQPILNPRLVMADVETGLGVGFTIFTGGYVDMHLFKMRGGKVYAVSAILANGEDSGWD